MKLKKGAKIGISIALAAVIFVVGIATGTVIMKKNLDRQASSEDMVAAKINYLKAIIDKYYLDYNDNFEESNIENSIYKGVFEGLNDPYSEYYTKEEYDELKESTSGSYCGIGAVVTKSASTGLISIVRLFDGSPALEAGAKTDDVIYKVEDEEVTGTDLDEVVANMKGEENTEVNITVYRPSTKKYIELKITRGKVDVPTVSHKMLKGNIGYVQIVEFDEVTLEQFNTAMDDLKKQGAKGYIFDVRSNPGGMYTTVCKMLDTILPEGTIVYTEDKEGKKEEQVSDASCLDVPLVVLQNGNSASASEIFAGAIKDFGAGKIIGTTSFGKGIVQNILPLSDGSAVKITIEKYFTPSGVNIQGTGIEPDVKVEDSTETEADDQLDKAIEILQEEM